MIRACILCAIHLALLATVGGKFLYERATLPRCWVRTATYDPNLPIRGRYVSLQLEVGYVGPATEYADYSVALEVRNGQLVAKHLERDPVWSSALSVWKRPGLMVLGQPVAYSIPENVPDPSRRERGEELWVEVSVPRQGPPRPIRLGVKRDGVLTPLEAR
jgi:hypothetical protein